MRFSSCSMLSAPTPRFFCVSLRWYFLPDPFRVRQQCTHVVPHRGVQHVRSDLRVITNTFSAKSVGVGADATIVGVDLFSFCGLPAYRFSII